MDKPNQKFPINLIVGKTDKTAPIRVILARLQDSKIEQCLGYNRCVYSNRTVSVASGVISLLTWNCQCSS